MAEDVGAVTGLTVTAAVLTGQLTIGWGNDLLDARRDRQVGREDKPLATGELSAAVVWAAGGLTLLVCVGLSLAAGWRSAAVHLGLVVLSGHAYNVGLKATVLSWLPYAMAFGALPAVVTLAGDPPVAPPWWMVAVAATLGVAAHLLNAVPDLAEDAVTGVRGLPHRLGARRSRVAATLLLLAATAVAAVVPRAEAGATGAGWLWVGTALVLATILAAVALSGQGRAPFRAAVAIAVLDVALLVAASPVSAAQG